MSPSNIEGAPEIEKIARNVLFGSKAWGKFPTPVDEIVTFAELQVAKGVDLAKVEPGFVATGLHSLRRAMAKVLAAIDLREKIIYLDFSQNRDRLRFNKLHETGHNALSWQRDLYIRLDDEISLDPDTDELFERQASCFASATLFQLERFEDEAAKLPLTIKSALVLAKLFGGSRHAALRRYVEKSSKRCALLVLNPPGNGIEYSAGVRNYFQSASFTAAFGSLSFPSQCGLDFQFVKEIRFGAKLHERGRIALPTCDGEFLSLNYHFFNNGHNVFVMLLPRGERVSSRTVIIAR